MAQINVSGNGRPAAILRWLVQLPQAARVVVLQVRAGDEYETAFRWDVGTRDREQYEAIAQAADAEVQSQASESGQPVLHGRLQWLDESGEVGSTKRLRVVHDPERETAGALDGSQVSWSAQMQRHQEAMVRVYTQSHQSQVSALLKQNQSLMELLDRALRARVKAGDSEADALRELALAEASATESDEREQRLLGLVETVVTAATPHVVRKLVSPAEPPAKALGSAPEPESE